MAARKLKPTTTDASATARAASPRPAAAKAVGVVTNPVVERVTGREHRSVNGAARSGGALGELNVMDRLGFVVRVAGSKAAAARLLDVDAAQTTRWAAGAAEPAGPQAVRLLDVEYVMAHAKLLWGTDELVVDWLGAPNAHLDHARPVDYVRVHGTADVVEALRAEAAGAYA